MSKRTIPVGFRMPREMVEWIDLEAGRQTRTRSNLIVHLVRQAMASTAPPHPLQAQAAPHAE